MYLRSDWCDTPAHYAANYQYPNAPFFQLVALLRDVKYLQQQDSPDRELPSSAANVYQQSETYRSYLQNLDVVVALYNSVRETILDVEYPLIEQQLLDIDKQLERAIAEINWTSSGNGNFKFLGPSLMLSLYQYVCYKFCRITPKRVHTRLSVLICISVSVYYFAH